jgi:hypothetical protein
MRLGRSSLRTWRTLVLGSALLVVAICAATEYWGFFKLGQVAAAFRHGDTALALATEDMRDEVLQLRRFEKDVLLNVGSPELVQSYQAKWEDAFLHLRYDLARGAEQALNRISESALGRTQTVDPALFAQRFSLAISLTLLFALVALYIGGVPRSDSSID